MPMQQFGFGMLGDRIYTKFGKLSQFSAVQSVFRDVAVVVSNVKEFRKAALSSD